MQLLAGSQMCIRDRGNTERLEQGMAFSIEPGIYPGAHGARIEDIVICGEQGCDRLNNGTRELVVVEA